MTTIEIPVGIDDEINNRILTVSEDRIQGFLPNPIREIANLAELDVQIVIQRIKAMLDAGTIRRVRQTLMATNLAKGSLVAWRVPEDKLQSAFDWMHENDPFTGHVVIRSTDANISGARYRLWTTLKVPEGFSLDTHCEQLCKVTGAEGYLLMPAHRLFALGVGHMRRRGIEPGSKADVVAEPTNTEIVALTELEWRVLIALKREFSSDEIGEDLWDKRAAEAQVSLQMFCEVAARLNAKGVIGRFSTFLEHFKPLADGDRVTKFNALFHWAVPKGQEMEAGQEVGRFHIMTHAYWREGGPEFGNVNIMGVAHGTDKQLVLAHKQAIDAHLEQIGIPVSYTNVFWGGRSEIKPSEISPFAYREWCQSQGMKVATGS